MALKKQVIFEHCKFSGDAFGWVLNLVCGEKNKKIEIRKRLMETENKHVVAREERDWRRRDMGEGD